jgi:hypothetical protein
MNISITSLRSYGFIARPIIQTHVVASEVVDVGLGEHGVVLEFTLAERGSVASDDDEFGLARSQGLES